MDDDGVSLRIMSEAFQSLVRSERPPGEVWAPVGACWLFSLSPDIPSSVVQIRHATAEWQKMLRDSLQFFTGSVTQSRALSTAI